MAESQLKEALCCAKHGLPNTGLNPIGLTENNLFRLN